MEKMSYTAFLLNPVNIALYVMATLIIIENTMTIGLICCSRPLHNRMNYIITNLAIVDCLTGISTILCLITRGIWQNTFSKHICQIEYAIWLFPAINSVLHLTLLTLDRYIAIIYSLQYHSILTTSRLSVSIFCCWLLSLAMVSTIMFGSVVIPSKNQRCYITSVPRHTYYIIFCNVGIVMIIILGVYFRIYKEISRQQLRIHNIEGPVPQNYPRNAKSVKILLLTVGCFIISWWPFLSCILIVMIDQKYFTNSHVLLEVCAATEFLATANSAMNPIIYIFRLKVFRYAYKNLFQSFKKLICSSA